MLFFGYSAVHNSVAYLRNALRPIKTYSTRITPTKRSRRYINAKAKMKLMILRLNVSRQPDLNSRTYLGHL